MKAVAPWVRTRLRTAPGSAAGLMLLVLLTSFLAAAFPRVVDRYETEGLRHEMSRAAPDRSALNLTSGPSEIGGDLADREAALRPGPLSERYRTIVAALPESVRADADQSTYGVRTPKPMGATDRWLPQLDGGGPVFTLSAQAGLAEHSTLRAGRLPRAAANSVTMTTEAVEAAVSAATAKTLGIKVGSTIHLPRQGTRDLLAVRVTGIVEPVRPALSYWSVEPVLRTPTKFATPPPVPAPYWHGALLLAPEAAPVLLYATVEAEVYWRIAPETAELGVGALAGVRQTVASLEGGPLRTELRTAVSPELEVESGLDDILIAFEGVLAAVNPVVAVAAFGVSSVAGVVLLMAGGLTAARRHSELSLLRSRGASVRGIAVRLLAEVAVPVLPGAAVGCALAFVLVPEGRPLPALSASAAVALAGCAALPLRAVFVHRRPQPHGGRDDLVRARPSRRRTVAELTLLVLAVAAVTALRRRGTADGEVDQLVSAAPVLLGVIAALLLVRLYPLPLRLAALPMARRRSAIGFLSLARAGRSPATAALPLLALLMALTTAAFGGSVLAGVADTRDGASLAEVGADARIEAADGLPDGVTDAVRKAPGVHDVAPVHIEGDLDLRDAGTGRVTLLAVDPESYARLARTTDRGAFHAGDLRKSSGVRPAVASPAVAERLGGAPVAIGSAAARFTVRVDVVRATTPGLPEGDFLVVDASGLPDASTTTLLVSGPSVSAEDLRAAAGPAGVVAVKMRSAERAALTESPVQSGAEQVYTVAVVAGAGYAVLALLLSLLRTSPERTALLSRLRTMGLTRSQGRRLLILESLPQALLAAVGGALVGWAAILLLAPGVDLGRLALAAQGSVAPGGRIDLRADPWSLLLPALALVVIAATVAAVQAWLVTRRTTTTELRAGDTR